LKGFQEDGWILAFLLNDFGGLLNFLEDFLQGIPNFFEILILQLVGNFSTKGLDSIPFLFLLSLYSSFLIIGIIIVITKGLSQVNKVRRLAWSFSF
jgi:hypothetical protein